MRGAGSREFAAAERARFEIVARDAHGNRATEDAAGGGAAFEAWLGDGSAPRSVQLSRGGAVGAAGSCAAEYLCSQRGACKTQLLHVHLVGQGPIPGSPFTLRCVAGAPHVPSNPSPSPRP